MSYSRITILTTLFFTVKLCTLHAYIDDWLFPPKNLKKKKYIYIYIYILMIGLAVWTFVWLKVKTLVAQSGH